MKLFDDDPKLRWLFCMTHPDDEISICAWIKRLTDQGAPVAMSWTHSIPKRETEARASSEILGVKPENLFFHHATDGSVCDEMIDLKPKFDTMIAGFKPDRIVCGAFEQGHLDHDATNVLVNAGFKGPVLEVPFYHTYHTRLQRINRFASAQVVHDNRVYGEEVLPLTPAERRFKKLIAKQYPSQNIWSVLLWYEAYQMAKLKRPELITSERMRLQVYHDFHRPHLPPKLATKVLKTPHWRRWRAAIEHFEKEFPPQR